MKFGCFCKAEHIEAVAHIGYDYVELSVSDMVKLSPSEVASVQNTLEKNNIPCLVLGDYCADLPVIAGEGFDLQTAAEYAKKACARAHELGARSIGVGAPLARTMPAKYSYYHAQEQAVAFFRATAEEALAYEGLHILVEALNLNSCNFINTQHQSLDLVRRIAMPNVLMEVDFFHMLMMAEPFDRFGDVCSMTGHLHISGKAEDDSRRFFAPEEGWICREALNAVQKSGYDGTMSVEVPPDLFTPEDAAASLAMLRKALLN